MVGQWWGHRGIRDFRWGFGTRTMLFHKLADFVVAWFGSRSYLKLLLGLPAILLGIGVMLGVLARPFYSAADKSPRYRTATLEALENGDLITAKICNDKLWTLDPENHDVLFYVAQKFLSTEGGEEIGRELVDRLAPPHKPVYAQAHRWLAQQLLGQPTPANTTPQAIASLAEKHLQHADSVSKPDAQSQYLWHDIYRRRGEQQKSLDSLAQAAKQFPVLLPDLLSAYAAARKTEPMKKTAVNLLTYTRKQIQNPELDSPQLRLQMAQAHQVLGERGRVLETLRAAWQKFPTDEELQASLLQMVNQQLVQMNEEVEPDVTRWLDAFRLQYDCGGWDLASLNLIQLMAQDAPPDALASTAERMLEFDSPENGAILADQLGATAASAQRMDVGRRWLTKALEIDAKNHGALNNLAWVLANSEPKDLDRALNLVDQALQLKPNDHRYRETRGQILTGLEQWAGAIKDLEFALNGLPSAADVHKSLAECYEQIGNRDLAQAHSKAAEE